MSYTQVKTLEPEIDNDHDELVGSSRRSAADEHVPHAYFKSSASLHTAISVAAGTVNHLQRSTYLRVVISNLIGTGHDVVWLRAR